MGLVILILGWVALSVASSAAARAAANDHLRRLATGNEEARREALAGIASLGVDAGPAVADALKGGDPALRRAALQAARPVLGSCRTKLDEMNCFFGIVPGRGAAESAFEQLKAALLQAIGDPDPAIRLEAVRLLAGTMDPWRVDLDPAMRPAAVVIRDALTTERDPSDRKGLVELLTAFRPTLHPEGATALVEATADPDEGVRQVAIRTLTDLLGDSTCPREEGVREKLRSAAPLILREAKARKRTQALLALGMLGEGDAVRELIALLHDPNQTSRTSAAVTLGRLGYLVFSADLIKDERVGDDIRKAVPPLVGALDDPVEDVRRHAAGALGSMGEAALDAIPAIEKAAEKEAASTRWSMTENCRSIRLAAEIHRLRAKSGPARAVTPRP
jgi:HEAT repeat protein